MVGLDRLLFCLILMLESVKSTTIFEVELLASSQVQYISPNYNVFEWGSAEQDVQIGINVFLTTWHIHVVPIPHEVADSCKGLERNGLVLAWLPWPMLLPSWLIFLVHHSRWMMVFVFL